MEIIPEVSFSDGEEGVGIRLNCRSCQRKMVGQYQPMMSGHPFRCPHCGHQRSLSPDEIDHVQCQADCLLIQVIGGDIMPSVDYFELD